MRHRLHPWIVAASVAGVVLVLPAQGQAAFRFGSKLDPSVQPSNAETAHPCDHDNPGSACTWVMNEAYGRPNTGHKSPADGRITRIRLIAGEQGSFRLQIVKIRKSGSTFQGKVVRKGPVIHYVGQPEGDQDTFVVESFKVSVPIKKGERLAIKTAQTSTLRCSSGGPNTLLFEPPIVLGGGFRSNTNDDGCWMLIEAVAVKS
jgi:hypothetical protein